MYSSYTTIYYNIIYTIKLYAVPVRFLAGAYLTNSYGPIFCYGSTHRVYVTQPSIYKFKEAHTLMSIFAKMLH
jgi:hypothetical protein